MMYRFIRLLAVLAALASAAPAQDPPGVKRTRIGFSEHLFVEEDIMLRGTNAEARVTFTRPASWKVLEGTKLHVFFSHSGVLLPDHSSLTVRVADVARSIRLDAIEEKEGVKELVIPIDPAHLGPYNPINFVAGLHYTLECEDPFHSSLWASISKNSYVEFVYTEEPAFTDLAVFPFPFFDPLAYPPVELTYLTPRSPDSRTLSALSRVAGAIAQDAAYRPLDLRFGEGLEAAPSGNYIIVGTPAEQPVIAELMRSANLTLPNGDAGFLASVQLPADRRYAALLVTGSTPEAVLMAASALVDRGTRATLVGSTSIIESYENPLFAEPRDWIGFAPDRTNFTLQDLGFTGQTVRGVFSAPIRVEVKLQPDARPVEYRQRLNIHYAYGALLKPEISTLEVILNGISLHSVPLDKREGSESEWLSLDVPWDIYGPYNRLELLFHMMPDTYRECERVSDRQLWGTIFPDSNFVLPRDYWTEFGDMSAVARWGYPFTLRNDLSDTVIVLPDPQASNAMRSMVRLVNFFMKPHPRQTIRLNVHYAPELNETILRDNHLIFVSPTASDAGRSLLGESAARFLPDGHVGVSTDRHAGLTSLAFENGAILESFVSPWNEQRGVMLAHESAEGVLGQLYSEDASAVLGQMRGAVVVVNPGGRVNSIDSASTEVLGHIPMARRARYVLAAYWQVFLGVGFLAIGLLYMAVRVILDRYRRRVVQSE